MKWVHSIFLRLKVLIFSTQPWKIFSGSHSLAEEHPCSSPIILCQHLLYSCHCSMDLGGHLHCREKITNSSIRWAEVAATDGQWRQPGPLSPALHCRFWREWRWRCYFCPKCCCCQFFLPISVSVRRHRIRIQFDDYHHYYPGRICIKCLVFCFPIIGRRFRNSPWMLLLLVDLFLPYLFIWVFLSLFWTKRSTPLQTINFVVCFTNVFTHNEFLNTSFTIGFFFNWECILGKRKNR